MLQKIKLYGWYLLHNRLHARDIALRKFRLMTLHLSQYYQECIQFYSGLDVKGKNVLDVGSDYGTTPMYFLSKDAKMVCGISMDKQYFSDDKYVHYEMELYRGTGGLKFLDDLRRDWHLNVLKSDIEGFEWEYTPEFVSQFDDWIIAFHGTIQNEELFGWIKEHGEPIGCQYGSEFAIYKKVVK